MREKVKFGDDNLNSRLIDTTMECNKNPNVNKQRDNLTHVIQSVLRKITDLFIKRLPFAILQNRYPNAVESVTVFNQGVNKIQAHPFKQF